MQEDLSVFLEDFGVLCNGVNVLLDEPDEVVGLGFDGVQASGPRMVFATGSLSLTTDQVVNVGGRSFRVRGEPRKIDDGAFSEVTLK